MRLALVLVAECFGFEAVFFLCVLLVGSYGDGSAFTGRLTMRRTCSGVRGGFCAEDCGAGGGVEGRFAIMAQSSGVTGSI